MALSLAKLHLHKCSWPDLSTKGITLHSSPWNSTYPTSPNLSKDSSMTNFTLMTLSHWMMSHSVHAHHMKERLPFVFLPSQPSMHQVTPVDWVGCVVNGFTQPLHSTGAHLDMIVFLSMPTQTSQECKVSRSFVSFDFFLSISMIPSTPVL